MASLRVARDKHAALPDPAMASVPSPRAALPGVVVVLADVLLHFHQDTLVLDVASPQPDLPAGPHHRVDLLVNPPSVEQHGIPQHVLPPGGAGLEEHHVPLGGLQLHGDLVDGGRILAVVEEVDVAETQSARGSGGRSSRPRWSAVFEAPGLPAFGTGLEGDDGLVPGGPLDLPQAAALVQLPVLHGLAEFPLHSRLESNGMLH